MKNSRFLRGSDKRQQSSRRLPIIHSRFIHTRAGQEKKRSGMRHSKQKNNFLTNTHISLSSAYEFPSSSCIPCPASPFDSRKVISYEISNPSSRVLIDKKGGFFIYISFSMISSAIYRLNTVGSELYSEVCVDR